jgi:hypothetical protein
MTAAHEEACWSCDFWRQRAANKQHGQCRRRAPQSGSDFAPDQWPFTTATAWCGEYEAAPTDRLIARGAREVREETMRDV